MSHDVPNIFNQIDAILTDYQAADGSNNLSMEDLRDLFAEIVPRDDPFFVFHFSTMARFAIGLDFYAGRAFHGTGEGDINDNRSLPVFILPASSDPPPQVPWHYVPKDRPALRSHSGLPPPPVVPGLPLFTPSGLHSQHPSRASQQRNLSPRRLSSISRRRDPLPSPVPGPSRTAQENGKAPPPRFEPYPALAMGSTGNPRLGAHLIGNRGLTSAGTPNFRAPSVRNSSQNPPIVQGSSHTAAENRLQDSGNFYHCPQPSHQHQEVPTISKSFNPNATIKFDTSAPAASRIYPFDVELPEVANAEFSTTALKVREIALFYQSCIKDSCANHNGSKNKPVDFPPTLVRTLLEYSYIDLAQLNAEQAVCGISRTQRIDDSDSHKNWQFTSCPQQTPIPVNTIASFQDLINTIKLAYMAVFFPAVDSIQDYFDNIIELTKSRRANIALQNIMDYDKACRLEFAC
ncbi:uncharacterized protein MELLADRAFT_112624 [Melampsora larici-populina 98AG31]|uniref:Uncharacterized protein n=1 Tax=Melampsora larici-populina (strain 98AG31 / pathotype 3-4-7) TaxID=747676 RepID=F4S728_MELLP|nr:uncharacterized protein MELLADRAFT_112624 [Melampsora larici-populina 98AG31]EGF99583.1 hypothetical protein MELLADRAFT_112624 [Melampsora larici-populina 98AG31]